VVVRRKPSWPTRVDVDVGEARGNLGDLEFAARRYVISRAQSWMRIANVELIQA
jgi:hypothetical protein